MANTPANISDDLYARLRHLFSEEQLLELGAHIAFENYLFEISCAFYPSWQRQGEGVYASVAGQFESFSQIKSQRLFWDRGRLARRERVARARAVDRQHEYEQD
jgi:hypothetical protein